MEEVVARCYALVQNKEKIKVKDLENLLKKDNIDDRKRFIEGYLPSLFSMTYNLYNTYRNMFNDSYDFEDLFYDAIELLIRNFDRWNYIENRSDYENISSFTNLIRHKLLNLLTKTNVFHITYSTWKKFYDLMMIKKKYQEDNDEDISFEELIDLCGLDKDIYCRLNELVNYDYLHAKYDIIDSYIEKENDYEAFCDIKKIINKMSNLKARKVMYKYFGIYPYGEKSIKEIANEMALSRQMIYLLKKQSCDQIKNNENLKKKYL